MYEVVIHRKDGSHKRKEIAGERNAYAWARMACNDKWARVFIGPKDQSHACVLVWDETRNPAENIATMRTPRCAT